MSKGTGPQVTKSDPWEGVSPHLKKAYGEAENIYETHTPTWYGGQTQADFSQDTLDAHQNIREMAATSGDIMGSAMDAYKYGTGSSILDVANNPYVRGMAQAAAQDAFSQLPSQFANIRSGSILSGGYGGGRQGIAEGTAISGASDAAARAAANIYGQAYGQGLGHQASTLGQTGSLISAGFTPAQQLSAVGQQLTSREQALIEDAKAKHEFQQNLPYQQLQQYTGTLGGTSGLLGGAGTKTAPGKSQAQAFGETAAILGKTFGTGGFFPI